MRRSSVAPIYTAVNNVELRVCVGTSLRLVRPSLPPTPLRVKGWTAERSLQLDAGAGALQLRLGLVGLVPWHALQHRLGRGVDQVLGLLETEAGEGADLLDHLDLLVAGGGQDDVELGLLLGLLRRGGGGGRAGDGHRGGGRDIECLLELLHELRQLQEGHLLEGVEELVVGNLGHGGWVSSYSGSGSDSDSGADDACWSRSALVMVATWRSGAASSVAVCCNEACSSQASRVSRTSRDSRVASRRTSSASSTLPSSTPPLTTRAGWVRAKSARSLATWTGSPWMNATAVGPWSSGIRSS